MGSQPIYGTAPPRQETNGLAVASLILGIVWLGGLGAVMAVIFGFVGKKRIDESQGRQTGRGLAVAGIVLGFVGIAGAVLFYIFIAVATFSINNSSKSYSDGENYGKSAYSANGDPNSVCSSASVPSGDDPTEFNLGCIFGWSSAALSSFGTSGNSVNNTSASAFWASSPK
ncbi:MAG: DUF4190 domain-containing protein [Acidimicrobiales bacterium]